MGDWEFAIFLLCTVLGILPLCQLGLRGGHAGWVGVLLLLVTSGVAIVFWPDASRGDQGAAQKPQWFESDKPEEAFLPRKVKLHGFVSAQTCRTCHPKYHASWHDTYHRSMTQVASEQAIANPAAFNDVTVTAKNRTYKLYRQGKQFWVQTADLDWEYREVLAGRDPAQNNNPPIVQRRIVMTTGSHQFQGYWVSAEGRGLELLQVPLVYSIRTKEWIPSEDVFIRPPNARRRVALWNGSCIQCHSVHGRPVLQGLAAEFTSTVADFGISCEACHGPGQRHVEFHRNPLNRYRAHFNDTHDPTIVNPAKVSPVLSGQICGQCHSAFEAKNKTDWKTNGVNFIAGKSDFTKTHHLFVFNDPRANQISERTAKAAFWADGTMRTAGREYMGLIASPCYLEADQNKKMHCLSCHSMHNKNINDQLKHGMRGNSACTQCHTESKYRDRIEEHTHHPAGSVGSKCYNCHMPYISYGLLKGIRSHQIQTPSATDSIKFGKPNGCNQCHTNKTIAWTARKLKSWYGTETPQGEDHDKVSATIDWALRGDAAQRALAAWTLGWKDAREVGGTDWSIPVLAQLLDDPYSAVRFIAFDSLKKQPGWSDFKYRFVGSAEHRRDAVKRAMKRWQNQPGSVLPGLPPRERNRLLLGRGRSLLQKRWQALLKRRDDAELEFPE